MLKRISVHRLRPGMFVHELCGSWMDHPFWKASFLLDDPKDLHRILQSSVGEAWIDTARGLDIEDGETETETETEVAARVEASLHLAIQPSGDDVQVGIAEELGRAAALCARAKPAMASMFAEARMGKAINAENALPLVEEIAGSFQRNPHALISMARLKERDDYTYMHSVAVCALMVALSKQLGQDEAQARQAGLGGLLHDLGKGAIPLDILNKPGKLTDGEFLIVKSHPEQGHRLLVEGGSAGAVPLDICLHHHEKTDGSGYPHRLADADISVYAKMGAVCDVYDAITSDRPYKNGWDPAESLRKMAEWSKGHFDQTVFQAFVKCLGIYPVGSLVRLASGRLGVVTEQAGDSLLTPRIRVFFSTRTNTQITPELVDLSRPSAQDHIVARENPASWGFANVAELWLGAANQNR